MFIVIGMTGKAILRCAFVPIGMTGRTLHVGMSPCQRKCRVVVIEGCLTPRCGLMTRTTICAKLTVVGIPGGMTGIAILRCTFVDTVPVTCLTGCSGMRTCQWEGRVIVIECHLLPAARGMAGGTDRSKLPLVYISGGMTREAILRRALIHVVHMAGLAGNVAV